ncbi:MAG TPA: antitoxin Xre/MbcA/ParS toxin-binding domain-containing protein [Acetobacteraceae bacterium]|nr:antitoxin Xre/MbcA/ParS toxin-binding domain-containing protein [Acetobacteraceae bacterium]
MGRGLPPSALDRLVSRVTPEDGSCAFRLLPRVTLARRRRAAEDRMGRQRLSPDQGARGRVWPRWALARRVWGDDDEARAFLFRPHPMLGGRRPVDVVLTNAFRRPMRPAPSAIPAGGTRPRRRCHMHRKVTRQRFWKSLFSVATGCGPASGWTR